MYRCVLLILAFGVCSTCSGQESPAGIWDCHLNCPGGKIRFQLIVEEAGGNDFKAFVKNGSEMISVPRFSVDGESLRIEFDHYDSSIVGRVSSNEMTGRWRKRRGIDEWVQMEFVGTRANGKNGKESQKRNRNGNSFAGRWAVKFEKSSDPAVGIFRAFENGVMEGTFLTTTGDYRFLFGRNEDHHMELSCFDGAHAFLFKAKLQDGRINGDFWSSNSWHERWTAVRNQEAKLPDAFQQTSWVRGKLLREYSFPDLDGKLTSLCDPKFDAPVKLIYIFGSWCPNCHDAAVYFKKLKKKYGSQISIVGIAFEHTGDLARDAEQVRRYLKRNDVEYPVLIGGRSDKQLAGKAATFVDKVRSYPTTLFVDAEQNVFAIHTGFTGPATGDAYTELKTRFESYIDRQLGK